MAFSEQCVSDEVCFAHEEEGREGLGHNEGKQSKILLSIRGSPSITDVGSPDLDKTSELTQAGNTNVGVLKGTLCIWQFPLIRVPQYRPQKKNPYQIGTLNFENPPIFLVAKESAQDGDGCSHANIDQMASFWVVISFGLSHLLSLQSVGLKRDVMLEFLAWLSMNPQARSGLSRLAGRR